MPGQALHPWLELDLERARRVVTRFCREYCASARANGVVVGLSGGIDSALTAALATEALGPGRVDTVHLPGPTSSQEDAEVASQVADHLGLELDEASIAAATEALVPELGIEASKIIVGNLQARLRMAVLYARAKAQGHLVAGTGNKSELLTGYLTKHGDGGVDIEPLGDLYKTHIRDMAALIGLPDAVIERPPTAGLWEGQTDEVDLGMSYATLDLILAGFERQATDEQIRQAAEVDQGEVDRVRDMVRRNWHKHTAPPVPKLGWRTVGVDWREPIT